MNLAEIIDYINRNVTNPSQLEGMRGMGLSIEPLPESYKAKKQTTDSGIDYYICNRNAETRSKLLDKLRANLRENNIDTKENKRPIQCVNHKEMATSNLEQRTEKKCSTCGTTLPIWALFCHICGNKYYEKKY